MGGISSLLNIIGFVGFLLFLAGIGLAVVAASQGRPVRGGAMLGLVGLLIGLVFGVIGQGILIVQPTEVAVVFQTLSGDLETPRRAGTHIIVPVIQTATIYPIEVQEYTMSGSTQEGAIQGNDAVRTRSIDGQEIQIDITVLYSVDPENVNLVHQRWQVRYQDDFVRPTVRGVARDIVSRFRADEIYGERRAEMEASLEEAVSERMAQEGFILTDILVRDVTFTPEFTASIERKQIAEQAALEAAFRVQEEQQEAERIRVRAAGARDAEIARAEGEARATILQAEAEAEALRLVSEQIAANPSLIQYLYVQNLSDNINLALVPSNTPFLFDFNSLLEPVTDFVAPEVPQTQSTPEPTPESTEEPSS